MKFGLQTGAKLFSFMMVLILSMNNLSALTLVPEKTSITSCICETNLVKLTASNTGDNPETVVLGSAGDKPWVIPGPKEFNLLPRASKEITAFVTPDCFAVPGKYQVAVNAKGNSDSATSSIGVDVSTCVQMQKDLTVSLCRGEVATAKFSIKNIARDEARTYALTVSSKDANPNSITVSPKTTVDVNSQKDVTFSVDSSNMNVGTYNFAIKAQALYEATNVPTTDVDTANLNVEVKNCEAFDLQLPESADVCSGIPTVVKAKLVNKGAPADLKLSSDSDMISIKPDAGTLHYGETADLSLTINANKGAYTSTVTAKSDLKTVEKQIKINGRDCYGVEMQLAADKVVCSEFGGDFKLSIKNRETPADYAISISGMDEAKLSADKITLDKSESEDVVLSLPKDATSGDYSATITATAKNSKDSITKDFSVQKCYDFRLTGPEVEICPCEETTVEYELINFGVKDDTFNLKSESDYLKLADASVSIKSKEKAKLKATINSCNIDSGKYSAIISATSKSYASASDKLKIDLTVKSKEQCYGIELKPLSTNIVSECGIKSMSVNVRNAGSKQTAVSLSADQGSKVTPDNLLLDAGESKEVFLVVFPSPSRCGTTFNVNLKAESKGISVSKQFSVQMAPEEKSTPTPISTVPVTPTPSSSEMKDLQAEVNYTNNTLVIKTAPDTSVVITGGENSQAIEKKTNSQGSLQTDIGAGTFLITLSRPGYKPVTLQVNVTGNQTGIGGGAAAGNLGSIPLLLVAFVIIVAALYFVLKRDDKEEDEEETEDEEEEMEEEEAPKPKRGRKRK